MIFANLIDPTTIYMVGLCCSIEGPLKRDNRVPRKLTAALGADNGIS